MKKVFITGANGCIGNVLVRYLLQRSYVVIALAYDDEDIDRIRDQNIDIAFGDICDKKKMREIFSRYNFDIVVHLAAVVHDPYAKEEEYMKVNYKATINLFELSKEYGIKQFIFISTVAVFGESSDRSLKEEDKVNPETPYAVSKFKVEQYLIQDSDQNINYTIVRPTTVYGKYDKGNINKLFKIAKKRIVPVIGDGANLKSFVFVDNLVEGIIKTIENKKAYNQIFIFSDNKAYSVNKILHEMEKIIGKKIIILHMPERIVFLFFSLINNISRVIFRKELFNISSIKKLITNNVFDISKAKTNLSYEPGFSLKEGLERTYLSKKND